MITENPLRHSLIDFENLSQQIRRYWLKPEQPFNYQAGDYIMLGFDPADLKPFSIANAPSANGLLELHIRYDQASPWMQQLFSLEKDSSLYSSSAKPQMQLHPESSLNLFIAGGTGLSPMKALLEARIAEGLTLPTKLYMGARQAEELYLNQAMQQLADNTPLLEYIPVISEQESYSGFKGLVHEVAIQQNPQLSDASVYLCGAWAMTQKAKQDFIDAGLNVRNFFH
ncbi:oxidoreductase [Thiomicrospira microaerophila]|uniref:oxidoreductase n=1 Tax=Thiomicrospira microaerophila TaxID=406020 RepID=UPI0020101534|nr:oxidoreductase [Thiomicrospira microaerophila]UQB42097.1 oxidoreductase [Thiomicrospira microaerophila]